MALITLLIRAGGAKSRRTAAMLAAVNLADNIDAAAIHSALQLLQYSCD